MKNTLRIAVLALALTSPLAQAATATATMAVTTTVLTSCTIAATPMAFGNYDPTSATVTNGVASITVLCTSGAAYNVGLSAGTASGATVSSRKMTSGGNVLPYALYSDSGRTTNWGTTIGSDTVVGSATGVAQILSVYGQITALNAAPSGAYTDTVTATVTY